MRRDGCAEATDEEWGTAEGVFVAIGLEPDNAL